MPKIAFLTGDLERNIHKIGERDYKVLTSLSTFRYALVNQGFDVDTVSLDSRDVPADVSTLVIADPRTALSAVSLARVQQYIDKGGNLLIVGEPGKQVLLNPVIQPLGVQLMDGTIAQPSGELSPDLVQAYMTATAGSFTKSAGLKRKDSVVVTMPGATGLAYTTDKGFDVKPLLMTDGRKTWMKKDRLITDSAAIVYSAANGDVRDSFATAVALSRKVNGKEQRIVVTGDADFMSNGELERSSLQNANFHFNTALFSWLSDGEFPIDTSRPESRDKRVKVTSDQVAMLKLLFIWVLPGLLLVFGTVLLIRRKRK
jgi:ABC-2 type transport system permease protein